MARRTTRPALRSEQQAEADRIHAALVTATADLRLLAEQLATTTDRTWRADGDLLDFRAGRLLDSSRYDGPASIRDITSFPF